MGFRHPMSTTVTGLKKSPEAEAASHGDDARRHLIRMMHFVDQAGMGGVHRHIAVAVDALDDARSLLVERSE